jgi:hypothetical protein
VLSTWQTYKHRKRYRKSIRNKYSGVSDKRIITFITTDIGTALFASIFETKNASDAKFSALK